MHIIIMAYELFDVLHKVQKSIIYGDVREITIRRYDIIVHHKQNTQKHYSNRCNENVYKQV